MLYVKGFLLFNGMHVALRCAGNLVMYVHRSEYVSIATIPDVSCYFIIASSF